MTTRTKPIMVESESGYTRIVWNGEVFCLGTKIDGKWFYQCLVLNCRASAKQYRPLYAALLVKMRRAGVRLSSVERRAASGSGRQFR